MGKNSIMKRLCLIVTLSCMLLMGLWHTGHGAWIYVKAELAQYLLARAWTKSLEGNQPVPPWPWADTEPIARLLVPQHGIEMFVLSGASGRTLAFGPGHVSSSALPGSHGTTIFNGHRDTHFKFLEHLHPKEMIILEQRNGNQIRFFVSEMKVVDSRHAHILQDESQPHLALITCFPFNAISPGSPLRYVVIATTLST